LITLIRAAIALLVYRNCDTLERALSYEFSTSIKATLSALETRWKAAECIQYNYSQNRGCKSI